MVVRTKFRALSPVMDERLTRLWAGAEADALGDGGIAIVERATGLSRTTIRAGRDELQAGVSPDDVIAVRSVCYLPLTYDHRLVDGADAGRFVTAVRRRLEEGAFEADLGL